MTEVLRIVGFLLMAVGGVLIASWFIDPIRELWPLLLALAWPIRLGLAVAAIGLLVIVATIVHDRLHADDRSLQEQLGEDE